MSSERDFEVAVKKFKLSKIDVFQQFHIARRIGPMLAELMPAMATMSKIQIGSMSQDDQFNQFAKMAAPFMAGLAKMSDDEANYVLFRLLSSAEVHQPEFGSWAKVATHTGIMMQDLELGTLAQIVGRAFMYNLSGFFASLPRA